MKKKNNTIFKINDIQCEVCGENSNSVQTINHVTCCNNCSKLLRKENSKNGRFNERIN